MMGDAHSDFLFLGRKQPTNDQSLWVWGEEFACVRVGAYGAGIVGVRFFVLVHKEQCMWETGGGS